MKWVTEIISFDKWEISYNSVFNNLSNWPTVALHDKTSPLITEHESTLTFSNFNQDKIAILWTSEVLTKSSISILDKYFP